MTTQPRADLYLASLATVPGWKLCASFELDDVGFALMHKPNTRLPWSILQWDAEEAEHTLDCLIQRRNYPTEEHARLEWTKLAAMAGVVLPDVPAPCSVGSTAV